MKRSCVSERSRKKFKRKIQEKKDGSKTLRFTVNRMASRKEGANIRKEEMYRGWFSFEEEKEWVSKLVPILIKRRPNENGDWGERHETKRGN